jgi:hypothetical protein
MINLGNSSPLQAILRFVNRAIAIKVIKQIITTKSSQI